MSLADTAVLLRLDHEHAVGATPGITPWEPVVPVDCRAALITNTASTTDGHVVYVRVDGRPAAMPPVSGSLPIPPGQSRLLALRGGLSIVGRGGAYVDVHPVIDAGPALDAHPTPPAEVVGRR